MNLQLDQFSWIPELERRTQEIVQEWRRLPKGLVMPWPQPGREFMRAIMISFHGQHSPVAKLCPTLMSSAARIPRLRSLTIQTMEPGAYLAPHRGATSGICRIHLGLDVPEGNWIQVEGKKTFFQTGKCFVFDDRQVHEVKNESTRPRTNLIIDCWAPWNVPGERVERVKHRLAHKLGVKRSEMVNFFPRVLDHVADFRKENPGVFRELSRLPQA
jgi:hypothetical protein